MAIDFVARAKEITSRTAQERRSRRGRGLPGKKVEPPADTRHNCPACGQSTPKFIETLDVLEGVITRDRMIAEDGRRRAAGL